MENPIFQYFGSTSESSDEYYENIADSYLDEKDQAANVHSADTDDFLVKQMLNNDFDEDEGREMFVYKETNGEFDQEEIEQNRSSKSTGLFSMITSGVTKAKSGIAKTVSQVGNMLKYSIIDKDSEQNWKEVVNWLSGQFEHSHLSKFDFLMGFLLLASFYKNHPRHTHNYVYDLDFIETSDFYLKFAYGAYGWKALYSVRRGHKTHFRGMVTKAKTGVTRANTEALCLHTGLNPEDIIEVNWKSEQFNPGHFIALSHKSQDIIVAIRGTSHLSDVLSDLMGKYEEFQNGFVHSGILKCAQNKCKRFLPILDNLLQKFPSYKLKIVGHSLGGGVAALLTILLTSGTSADISALSTDTSDIEKPSWPIQCWAYASPCVVSKSISLQYTDTIYSFALDNDPISRISHGSAEALKNACVQLALQAENNWQRMFHIVKESVGIHDSVSKKIASFLKVKGNVDMSKVDCTKSDVEKLVPTGRIFHVYENEEKQYVMEESDHDLFTEIVISNRMINDHFPINYEARWRKVLENEEMYKGKQELEEEVCL